MVRATVDEKLLKMQNDKQAAIDAALGDNGARTQNLTISELLRLFGPVGETKHGFIWPENDDGLGSEDEGENAVPGFDPHTV